MTEGVISATSVMCAAGFGAPQVWSSVRSRVSRIRNSSVMDRQYEPIPMGLVPEEALDADDADLDALTWPARARRMLRLATPTLRELASAIGDTPVALRTMAPPKAAQGTRMTRPRTTRERRIMGSSFLKARVSTRTPILGLP